MFAHKILCCKSATNLRWQAKKHFSPFHDFINKTQIKPKTKKQQKGTRAQCPWCMFKIQRYLVHLNMDK